MHILFLTLFGKEVIPMEKEEKVRKYKNDEFKINIIYDDKGKTIFKVIEEAFKNYYDLKVNT